MWSRKFLWQGLTTGVLAASLALAGMWLVLFVVARDSDPGWTIANVVKFCLPGMILYPACWYAWIFRRRDYSLRRTMTLVIATFLVGWALVASLLAVGGAYVAVGMALGAAKPAMAIPLVVVAPLAYLMMSVIGAVILFVPFAAVAAPIAFLHRWLLLLIAPNPGAAPSA